MSELILRGRVVLSERPPIAIEPESQLVVRARRYESDALAEIFERHYAPLYRFALARLGDSRMAEEAVWQGLASALADLPCFHDRGAGLLPWLYRHVHRAILQRLPHGDPGDDTDRIRRALLRLSPEQQEVLSLRLIAGLTPKEVAAATGRREGGVVALQHRALMALQRLLAEAPAEAE